MTGAAHHRGRSRQDFGTPDDFLTAVLEKFQIPVFEMDLACTRDNAVECALSRFEGDSLSYDWSRLSRENWLNPPFGNIAPWAEQCNAVRDGRIYLLTPASVGSNWFRDWVFGVARVYFLNGRLRFKGAPDYYPKDCMLSVFGLGVTPGCEVWTWK